MKLFLFDFDGVLVESLDIYEKVVSISLARMGVPLTGGREEFLELFERNFYESLAGRNVDVKQYLEAASDLVAAVTYRDMQPVAPMLAVVEKLQKDNILLVISSNNSPTIRTALEQFQYSLYFQEVLGSDFLFSKKDKILYALDKYRIEPADAYYIGDTTGDIREGRSARVKTVGITWGWHTREKMMQAGPDYLLDRPEELLQLAS